MRDCVRTWRAACFQKRTIDIAIVGGGATGVELAAELSRMVELAAGYGEVDIRRRLRVTLLESASRILGAFPDAVSTSAGRAASRAWRRRAHGSARRGRRRARISARRR
jgi:NADH dehydrogenase FAD-containing subunit